MLQDFKSGCILHPQASSLATTMSDLYVLNVPVMTIGIGVYLPLCISAAASVGALIKFIIVHKRPQWDEKLTLAASGFMDGEGVMGVGVIIAFIQVLTGKM